METSSQQYTLRESQCVPGHDPTDINKSYNYIFPSQDATSSRHSQGNKLAVRMSHQSKRQYIFINEISPPSASKEEEKDKAALNNIQ